MTYEEREAVFAKEVLTIDDVASLYACSKSYAAQLIREWKRRAGDRLNTDGRIHYEDYKAALNLPNSDRYRAKEFWNAERRNNNPFFTGERKSVMI